MKKILRKFLLVSALVLMLLAVTFTASAEAGEEMIAAQTISVNNVYTDNISSNTDVDYFSFTLTSSGSVYLDFSRENLFDAREYWSVALYDSNSNYITDCSFLGNTTQTSTHKVGLDAGTYFIRIRGGDWYYDYSRRYSTTDYNFTVKYAKSAYWEKENNESYSEANKIALNKKYSGTICENNDVDFYKITLKSNGYIYLNFKNSNLFDAKEYWTATLYDINSNYITDCSFSGNVTETNTYKVGLAAGTYFIRIRGGDWYYDYSRRYSTTAYSFTVKYSESDYWEKENNESYNTARKVALHKKYSGTICENNDVDFYKFTLKQKTSLNLKFFENITSDSQEYYTLTLLDSNTNEITNLSVTGNVSTAKQSITLNKGTYYIRIRGGDWYYDYSRRYKTDVYGFAVEYTNPGKPSGINSISSTSAIKLEWGKASEATGYRVYMYNPKTKKYEKIKTTTERSYKVTGLKAGTVYKFKVKAYKKIAGLTLWGSATGTCETATKCATPTVKVSSTKKGIANLSWTNVAGESGYQIYMSTKKDSGFKHLSNYKANSTKATKSKLTSGKTYYFRVRAYKKTDSGVVYGGYQTVGVRVK